METRDVSEATTNWLAAASAAAEKYKRGVRRPRRNWRESALAAESSYETGVQEAIGRKAFGKGIADTTEEDWKNNAENLGARHFPEGVRAKEGKYREKMAPVIEKLRSITLSPRGPRGSAANIDRATAVMREMHALRVGS